MGTKEEIAENWRITGSIDTYSPDRLESGWMHF
jgi:hypothetical protein